MPTHLGRRKLCPLSRNAWMVGPRNAGLFVAVGILAACARPEVRDTQAPEVAIPSQPPTAAASDTPLSTVEPLSSPQGFVLIPTGVGDAGNFFIYAGSIITLTWESPPSGAARYDFVLTPFESSETVVLGSDLDASDGVSAEWQVPEDVGGSLRGAAHFPDGRLIYSHWSGDVYSGEEPPEGVCTLASGTIGALDVFAEPSMESEAFAYLVPGNYADVLARTVDGWYWIDASTATDTTTGKAATGWGWVAAEYSIELFGPCGEVPLTGP